MYYKFNIHNDLYVHATMTTVFERRILSCQLSKPLTLWMQPSTQQFKFFQTLLSPWHGAIKQYENTLYSTVIITYKPCYKFLCMIFFKKSIL